MTYPTDLKYTKDHEWIRINDQNGHIGITVYAQEQLGDVVYVELPEVGRVFAQADQFGSVESVKEKIENGEPLTREDIVDWHKSLSAKGD